MNVPSVPVDQLLALSQASDEMLRSVFHRDHHAALRTVTQCVHDLLSAEYCGIFLVPEDAPHELELTAQCSDLSGHEDPPPVRLPIHSAPKGGMTGHIAEQGDGCPSARDPDHAEPLLHRGCPRIPGRQEAAISPRHPD